ncbi:MAG: sigma-70 family RNA polymerase sigma factor [Actinomycetota bacterium]|nr:sigma-70 family RNA polymerase sigma factor [Actinomycetota bacterium]
MSALPFGDAGRKDEHEQEHVASRPARTSRQASSASHRRVPERRGSEPEGATANRREGVPTWQELVVEHRSFVYSVAYRLTGNPDDASDLAHDVLLRARDALSRYRPGSIRGWLLRITTNLFYDRMRSAARRQVDPMPTPDEFTEVSTLPSPDEAALNAELEEVVEEALRKLLPEFRLAVVLCDLRGLRYEEIASLTGWCIGTVRSRIHRGRTALRPLLEPYLQPEG